LNDSKEPALSEPASASADPILVALGSEARTLRLVHTGFRLAREQGRPWVAVHVEVPGWETAGEADQARVWLQEARDLGAATAWVKAATVSEGVIEEGLRNKPSQVVMGKHRARGPWDRLEHTRAQEAIRRLLGARIVTIPLDPPPVLASAVQTPADLLGVVLAITALLGVCTIFAKALFTAVGFPGIPPVYALGVGFIAHRWGRAFSVPASMAAVLAFAAWFVQGRFPFQPEDWDNGLYLAGALVLVQMVVVLVDQLHQETRSLRRREAETLLVMLLGRALGRCSTTREVAQVLAERMRGLSQAQAWMLVPGEGDAWVQLPEAPEAPDSPRPSELLPQFSEKATRAAPRACCRCAWRGAGRCLRNPGACSSPWRCRAPWPWSGSAGSRRPTRPGSTSSPSACATPCWGPSRTTCAHRWRPSRAPPPACCCRILCPRPPGSISWP
jgi:K+-sensing histidine kinase KdpD